MAGLAWSTATTQYINDSDSNPLTKGFWASGTQLLAVPLLVDASVIGVAVLGAPNDLENFTTSTGLVSSLANLAAIAIANAKSQELIRSELKRTRALSEISRQVSQFKKSDALMTSVSKTLMDAMDICRTSSLMVNDDGELQPFAAWQRIDGEVKVAATIPDELVKEAISNWCFEHNECAQIPRNHDDPRES